MSSRQQAAPPIQRAPVQGVFVEGLQHHQAGRLADAEHCYRQVLAVNDQHTDSLNLLGVVAHQTARPGLAMALISEAIAINGHVAAYHSNLGNLLRDQGVLNAARACYGVALELNPDDSAAHYNLGITLRAQRRLDDAAACYRRAVALRPSHAEAYNNLGALLREQGRLEEAAVCLRQAIQLQPKSALAQNSLAAVLRDQGLLDQSIMCLRRAIEADPGYADAHASLGMALLAKGDLAAGWPEFEWRWQAPQLRQAARRFAEPQWKGEPAEGRVLLIHSEQGFGDTIQFCRYAALAADRGFRVVMEAPKALIRLLGELRGVDELVASGSDLPPFDLHCPMLSLPLALGTTLSTVPRAPSYLHADASMVAGWAARLGAVTASGPRVGLVWAGGAIPAGRSIAPERLAPLFAVPGLQMFGLQKDPPLSPLWSNFTDFMAEMTDFADTAALIANLDLVIAVDTAIAHLAGALGKPVWLMAKFDPCWRWLTGRRDSPWYPTMRLYRQPRPGDWDQVVAEIAQDLRDEFPSKPGCAESQVTAISDTSLAPAVSVF